FNKDFEAAAGQWTTLTIPVTAVPPNVGSPQLPIEIGDKYRGVGMFVGRPGQGAELYVDLVEIVDIER
ncbi:MAG TPA: hypothetical protein VEJ18_04130, partial [Planctomycetota bacterium]|nr:hypothetical protein [Planctomycetota bacterium]